MKHELRRRKLSMRQKSFICSLAALTGGGKWNHHLIGIAREKSIGWKNGSSTPAQGHTSQMQNVQVQPLGKDVNVGKDVTTERLSMISIRRYGTFYFAHSYYPFEKRAPIGPKHM